MRPVPSERRRRIAWVVVALSALTAVTIWVLLPWEWSVIDDPGLVRSVQEQDTEHGFLPGLMAHVGVMFEFDRNWSLFRPLYWVYPSLVYWLPIGLAHGLRLLMLIAAIGGPLVALRRRGATWVTVAAAGLVLVAGAMTLMLGLFYVSLQELSGAALVGLGLMSRSFGARAALWLGAAWFKSTFAWLLVGEAWVAWREGSRRRALLSAVLGVGTLAVAGLMARHGTYTGAYLRNDDVWATVIANAEALVSPSVLLPLLAAATYFVVMRVRPAWHRESPVLLVGFVGYFVQLLPWVTTGYYSSGAVYLMSLFLVTLMPMGTDVAVPRALAALTGPFVVAASAVAASLVFGLGANSQWRETTACLVRLGPSLAVVGREFPYENAWRIEDTVRLRSPAWAGRVVSEGDVPLDSAPEGSLLIVRDDRSTPIGRPATLECEMPGVRILRMGSQPVSDDDDRIAGDG